MPLRHLRPLIVGSLLCLGLLGCSDGTLSTPTADSSPAETAPRHDARVDSGMLPDSHLEAAPAGDATADSGHPVGDTTGDSGHPVGDTTADSGQATHDTTVDSGHPAGDVFIDTGTPPAGLILYDGFDYEVRRDDPNVRAVFVQHGPWSYAKSDQDPNHTGGAGGWLYTVASIPGFTGAFPGRNSTRVLCVESGAGTYAPQVFGDARQTDFYLQYGDTDAGDYETVPGNVWFQFWIYVNDYGTQRSTFGNSDKWIYPTRNGYPSTELHWLLSANNVVFNPNDYTQPDEGFHTLGLADRAWGARATVETPLLPSWNQGKIGQNLGPTTIVTPNQWWLVKLHANTSGNGPNAFEIWVRPHSGQWAKVTSYIAGVTTSPELPGTLTWNLDHPAGGHRGFRFPTTMNSDVDNPGNGDSWTYIDDFAMAHSEADLPVYEH